MPSPLTQTETQTEQMRFAIRAVAVLAALSFSVTLAFVAAAMRNGALMEIFSRGAFGAATAFEWGVTLTAGPLVAIELWRFRERGRRVGLVLFGSGLLYYVVGLFAWKSLVAPLRPIVLAMAIYAAPVILLLLSAGWFRRRV